MSPARSIEQYHTTFALLISGELGLYFFFAPKPSGPKTQVADG